MTGKSAPSHVKADDIAALSFEDALRELEEIVRRLETGQTALEASMSDYDRGMALKAHCTNLLKAAKLRVEKIIKDANGAPAAAPFDGKVSE